MIGPSFRRRDALIALGVGSFITFALNIWFNSVAQPHTIGDYIWLARLQEPGAQVGEKLARSLHPVVGYPWNVRLAIPCAYGVLIALWMIVVLVVIGLCRLTASLNKALSLRRAAH
jgi:hypothetical protein